MPATKLKIQLADLKKMALRELREEWRKIIREQAPDLSADILARGVAYRLQEQSLGGLNSNTRRHIKRLASQFEQTGKVAALPSAELRAGTRLARDWHGKTHHVLVLEDGFLFEERNYRSLSQIARAITGTRWSGPRFFGLIKRKSAAPARRDMTHA